MQPPPPRTPCLPPFTKPSGNLHGHGHTRQATEAEQREPMAHTMSLGQSAQNLLWGLRWGWGRGREWGGYQGPGYCCPGRSTIPTREHISLQLYKYRGTPGQAASASPQHQPCTRLQNLQSVTRVGGIEVDGDNQGNL